MLESQSRLEFEGCLSQYNNFTNERQDTERKMKLGVICLEEVETDAPLPAQGPQEDEERCCTKGLLVMSYFPLMVRWSSSLRPLCK